VSFWVQWTRAHGSAGKCLISGVMKIELNDLLCKFGPFCLQHSETFDILHAFLRVTIAELSTLKQVRVFFLAHSVYIYIYTGWSKKRHKVNDTIILQPYVKESCGFQHNVPKEILCMTKVSIWIQQLNVLCYCCWQLNYAKTVLPLTLQSIKMYHFYFFNNSVKHWLILIIFGMRH